MALTKFTVRPAIVAVFSTLILTFNGLAYADTNANAAPSSQSSSAVRAKGIPAEFYIRRALGDRKSLFPGSSASVVSQKAPFDQANWSRIPLIAESELLKSFETIRDERPFHDEALRPRRATWLYPDDGCFVRAVVADSILRQKFSVSNSAKIYAFGNLQVQTKNSPYGEVEWWYHVAAIAKVRTATGEETFVYDPAIDSAKPMPVKDWLATMSDSNIEVAICSGASYDPYSACESDAGQNSASEYAGSVSRAHREANWFLPSEWDRVVELGRDPHQELLK